MHCDRVRTLLLLCPERPAEQHIQPHADAGRSRDH